MYVSVQNDVLENAFPSLSLPLVTLDPTIVATLSPKTG